MISVALFPLLGCCLLADSNFAVSGAPTTYDQRQDGDLNLAAKVENILVVVALPSKKSNTPSSYNDALEAYLTLAMTNQNAPLRAIGHPSPSPESITDQAENEEQNSSLLTSSEEETIDDSIFGTDLTRPARSLPSSIDDPLSGSIFDNELLADQNREKNKFGERNEAFKPLGTGPWKLIGGGIEDCGPERQRNSYGVCEFTEIIGRSIEGSKKKITVDDILLEERFNLINMR